MAAANLLALLDDITSALDDVALMTRVAAKKTVGVLGDDLALNAQQVSGNAPDRELPVVWSVAKGSLVNKAVLIPLALAASIISPRLITVMLMLGGAYLCYEGAEKILEKLLGGHGRPPEEEDGDRSDYEKRRIRGAVRTDFILSAEVIVIALGSLPPDLPLWERAAVLVFVGLAMTAGVYGLVAAIVKLDDAGLWLIRRNAFARLGRILVGAMPYLMRFLAVAGTVAMFMVGGGILVHAFPALEGRIEALSGVILPGLKAALLHIGVGLAAGLILVGVVAGVGKMLRRMKAYASGDS